MGNFCWREVYKKIRSLFYHKNYQFKILHTDLNTKYFIYLGEKNVICLLQCWWTMWQFLETFPQYRRYIKDKSRYTANCLSICTPLVEGRKTEEHHAPNGLFTWSFSASNGRYFIDSEMCTMSSTSKPVWKDMYFVHNLWRRLRTISKEGDQKHRSPYSIWKWLE